MHLLGTVEDGSQLLGLVVAAGYGRVPDVVTLEKWLDDN